MIPLPQRFGRYELVTRIGRGGMAELWLGRLVGVGGFSKLVAIKRILPHLASDPRFVDMFLREGRIAARLSHANVCHVYELGEVDGELFLAMEYLDGVAWSELEDAIPREPPAAVARIAAAVVGQACDGLAYAHAQGVVHRDVSPPNLFVTTDGTCKLLDFGVSKLTGDADQTRSGLVKGKLPYMPPEQIRGDDVDVRADVFAAGVVLWEALAGQRLFLRDNDFLIYEAVCKAPIPALAARYGPGIDRVLARALDRDRDARYPTIRAFADDLRAQLAPCTNDELGVLVRDLCGQKLAERAASFAEASKIVSQTTDLEIAARTKSVAVKRKRRAWLWIPASIGVGVAAAVGVSKSSSEPKLVAHDARRADAAVVIDAAVADAAVPVDAEEEEIVIDEPGPGSTVRPRRVKAGYYSVSSRPYATIYIDGKLKDQTPLFRVPLAAGKHQIKAVLADGRQKSFAVQIEPGKELSSGTLTW